MELYLSSLKYVYLKHVLCKHIVLTHSIPLYFCTLFSIFHLCYILQFTSPYYSPWPLCYKTIHLPCQAVTYFCTTYQLDMWHVNIPYTLLCERFDFWVLPYLVGFVTSHYTTVVCLVVFTVFMCAHLPTSILFMLATKKLFEILRLLR